MFEFLSNAVQSSWFYPGVALLLWLSGLGAPISADLVLIFCGYWAYHEKASLAVLIPLSVFFILLSDTTLFFIARKFGPKILTSRFFSRLIAPEKLRHAEKNYQQHGYKMIFIARFLPGIRTIFVFTGGTLQLKYWKFILHDFAGGVVMIPVTLMSSFWVAGNISVLIENLKRVQWFVLPMIAVLLWWSLRSRKKGKKHV